MWSMNSYLWTLNPLRYLRAISGAVFPWFGVYGASVIRDFWCAPSGPEFVFSDSEKLIWTVVLFTSWLVQGASWFRYFTLHCRSERNAASGILHPIKLSHWEHPAFINTADNHLFRFAVNLSWHDVSTVLFSLNGLTLLVVINPDRHMLTELTVWQLIKGILRH